MSNKKIKVLFLVGQFVMGGIEKANIVMINNIDKNKFDVHVLYIKDGILMDELTSEVKISRLGNQLKLKSLINLKYILKIMNYIKDNNIEIVHTIDSVLYFIGATATHFTKTKHVRTQPNFIRRHEKLNTKTLKILPFEKWTNKFITYQYGSAKDLNLAGVKMEKIETICDFSRLEDFLYYSELKDIRTEFNIPKENKIILAMHRMVEKKGYEMFIEMIPYIVKKYSNVTFLLVGDGPLRKKFEDRVDELGINQFVVFTGFRKDAANIVKQIEFGVYPLADTAAMVTVINAGKILITKKNSSMDEYIIDGETGLLVPEEKPEVYAKFALLLLNNKEKLLEMESKQKEYVLENFNGIENMKKLEKIFIDLCKDSKQ